MPDILFFDEITDASASLVGGKGLSLGKTAAAGLPVPAGFVVTTQAYRRLASRGARADAGFARAVAGAYESLGGGLVAVRSSVTAEDAADTSFAGQQETLLDVRGADAVLEAVVRCWASLWSDRAVDYRDRQGVAPTDVRLAVVIQEMVEATASGVLFTADPTTGRRDRIGANIAPKTSASRQPPEARPYNRTNRAGWWRTAPNCAAKQEV